MKNKLEQPDFSCVKCGKPGHYNSNLCNDCKPGALEEAKETIIKANPLNKILADKLEIKKD